MAQAKRPCSSGPSCSSAVPSRPPPRLGRARRGGSRCVTLSARAAFQTNTTCSAGPEGKKRRKKGQKREAWPLADAANRARGFWRAGRAPGEAARGWWPRWVLSPFPSPRCRRYLPSSSPRGSTSSGGSTGIGCGGAGRSGSRGWTCREDRADVAPGSTVTAPAGLLRHRAGALGHGPAASSRCHAAPVHTLTHTHSHTHPHADAMVTETASYFQQQGLRICVSSNAQGFGKAAEAPAAREELRRGKRSARLGGWGLPPPGDAPITRQLAGGRSGPGRARNSNYFLRSCRTGLPLRARLLWGRVLGATALRRPRGCSPVLPEQPRSLQWGQCWPPWK